MPHAARPNCNERAQRAASRRIHMDPDLAMMCDFLLTRLPFPQPD